MADVGGWPSPRCDECGTVHGPGNTNTLCSRASNYRGLGHSAWKSREITRAEQRVLDAMSRLKPALLRATMNAKNYCSDDQRDVAAAELARRGLEP